MKRVYLLCTLMLTLLGTTDCFSQDFSNKGKEFWLAYCYHVGMAQNGFPVMTVYITSDVNTPYKVEIYGVGTIQSGNITAGQVISVVIPTAYFINAEGTFPNRAIRVSADKPVVVYSYITRSAVSGATISLPTNVLGKEYYAMSFTQVSNEANSNSYFTIIAVEDNTSVEITPSGNTKNGWIANTTYTVNLNKGQIYQVLGALTGNNGVDLSGSKIKSVASAGGGCKRIAVYSGTGKVSIGCAVASSSDNLYQQLYPVASWGKKYLTLPSYNRTNNYYRIAKSNVAANVYLNGVLIPPATFVNNIYYQFSNTSPNKIESDLPISVTQYFTTQGCAGNGTPYDPDMIVLNPVEQNIDKVTLVSSNLVAFNPQHHLHVIMRNGGTGISSFKLDNILVSPSSWTTHPQDPAFSYLYLNNVSQGYHTIAADSGFNALAYGYADNESYGYSAGANVKDLYQFVTVKNQYATVNFPAACKNSPFYFSMTFPYQPTRIEWKFGTALNTMGLADVTINSPTVDSFWTVNGKTLFRYNLPAAYSIGTSGTYPITVLAQNPTSDGCGGEQEINYDLQVFDPPVADFTFVNNGCVTNAVQFTSSGNTGGRPVIQWAWDFADGNTSAFNNPNHMFSSPGSYNVKYSLITDVGCLSDTASHLVTLTDLPVSKFAVSSPDCAGKPITFTDESTITAGATLVKWIWNFGDGSPVVTALSNASQTHSFAAAGNYNVSLVVETATGCGSLAFVKAVIISPNPVANFNLPAICLPLGTAQFNSTSTISDGTQNLFMYAWNFGDGGTAVIQNPIHNYTGSGPFNVTLTVTSNNGCTDDSIRVLSTVYPEPQAAFSAPAEVCLGAPVNLIDASTVTGSSVTQWSWDFGDGTSSTQQSPAKTYNASGTFTVKLNVASAFGCQTVNNFATRTIVVNPLPTPNFNFSLPACEKGNISFSDASAANAGSLNKWTWNFGDGSNAVLNSGAPFNHIFATAGTYDVKLIVETTKGCTSTSFLKKVVIYPKPVADFNLPAVCLPVGTAQFNSASTISDGTQNLFTYAWSFGDGGTATIQNPIHNYSGTGPFNVKLTITSNNGCTHDSTKTLNTIYAEPQAVFNSPVEVCLGSVANFTDASTAAGSTVTKWNWDFGDGTASTQQNPVKTYSAAGTYSVKLNVISAIGCQTVNNFATRTIIINPLPTGDFNFSLPACETRNISFSDASAANAGSLTKWTWNFGDSSNAVLNSGATFSHVFTTAGTYNVTLLAETNKGCISNLRSKQVVINPVPVAGFISPEICLSDPFAPFSDTSSIASGNIVAWEWNFGDANSTSANPNTSTLQNPNHRYSTIGSYTASLIVTSNNGCKDTVIQNFTVNGSVPVAGFTVQNSITLCSNQAVSIKEGSTVDFGSLVKLEIYWDYVNSPAIMITDDIPVPGKIYSHTYPEFGTPTTKSYSIRYVAYSGINCVNVLTKTITVLATPSLQFAAISPVCSADPSFQITQAQLVNGLPGAGVFSGKGISSNGIFTPAQAGLGTQMLRYTYTGTNTCINFVEQSVEINPTPGANAGPDKIVLEGGVVTLTPALNASLPVTYLWTPSTGLADPTKDYAVASPPDDITYTLTVTTDKGCQASDKVFVKVLKAPVIPNIFSPNGDGVHDKLEIGYLESYPGCVIDIYNRYGQHIFHSVGYSQPWDGTIKGKPAPIGTYYYIVDPKNGRKKVGGYVDIIR